MPIGSIISDSRRAGEFLINDANGFISREKIIIAPNQDLKPGQVIAAIVHGAVTVQAGTNTGNGSMGTVTLGANAKKGDYLVRITTAAANAGGFTVYDPEGGVVGTGTVGAAFTSSHVNFTLADGATDFAVGDTFVLTTGSGSGQYASLNPAGTNGTEDAVGIVWDRVVTGAGETAAVTGILRHAEVHGSLLVWPVGITTPQKNRAIEQLAARQIFLR